MANSTGVQYYRQPGANLALKDGGKQPDTYRAYIPGAGGQPSIIYGVDQATLKGLGVDPNSLQDVTTVSKGLGLTTENGDFYGVAGGQNFNNDVAGFNNVLSSYAQSGATKAAQEATLAASNANLGDSAYKGGSITPQQQANAPLGSTARTNELLGGQYFDPSTGAQIKPFTAADAQANKVNYSSTIPTTTLQTQTPITIPQAPAPTNTSDAIAAGADQFSKNVQTQQTQTENSVNSLENEISSLLGTTVGRGEAQLSAEQQANVPGLKQELSNVNGQIQIKLAEFKKVQEEYAKAIQVQEGKTIPMNLIIGREAEINRSLALQKNSFAADIGLLQAQASALQGNLDIAQQTADRAVDLRYADAKTLLDVKFQQLDLLRDQLNREEAKTANALAIKYQQERDALSIQVANEKDKNNTILNFIQENPGAKISLTDSVEVAAQKAATYQQTNGGISSGLMEISAGASLYDPATGKFVATAPKSYAPSTNNSNQTTNNVKFTATEQKNYEAFKSEVGSYSSKSAALADLSVNKSAIITKIGQAGYDLLVKDIENYFINTPSNTTNNSKGLISGGVIKPTVDSLSNFLYK